MFVFLAGFNYLLIVHLCAGQQPLSEQASPGGSYGRALYATQVQPTSSRNNNNNNFQPGSMIQPQQQQPFNYNQAPVISPQDIKYPVGNNAGQAPQTPQQQSRPVVYGPVANPMPNGQQPARQLPGNNYNGINSNNNNNVNTNASPDVVDFSKPNNARCECYIATLMSNDTIDLMDILLPFGSSRSITTDRTDVTCRELKTQCIQHCLIQKESCLVADLQTPLPGQDPPVSYGSYACKTLPTKEEIRKPAAIFYELNAMYCKDEGFISRLNDYYCCLNFRHPFVEGENLRLFSPQCFETMAPEYCGSTSGDTNSTTTIPDPDSTGSTEAPMIVRSEPTLSPTSPNFDTVGNQTTNPTRQNNTGSSPNSQSTTNQPNVTTQTVTDRPSTEDNELASVSPADVLDESSISPDYADGDGTADTNGTAQTLVTTGRPAGPNVTVSVTAPVTRISGGTSTARGVSVTGTTNVTAVSSAATTRNGTATTVATTTRVAVSNATTITSTAAATPRQTLVNVNITTL